MGDISTDLLARDESLLTPSSQKRQANKKFTYPAEGILPPCKVCGEKASGYHFGAVTCEACKVFFHRSHDRVKEYKCKSRTKKCVITYMNKPICAYCRLVRCFSLGMGKDSVKRGRYSLEMRTEHILEANASELPKENQKFKPEKDEIMEKFIEDVYRIYKEHLLFLPDQLASIAQKQKEHLERFKREEQLFGPLISWDRYQDIKSVTGVEIDDRKDRINKCVLNQDKELLMYINAFKSMPGFSKLHFEDRNTLTKDNRTKWNILAILPGVNVELKVYTCPSCEQTFHMREMEIHFGMKYVFEKFRISKILKEINLTEKELALVQALSMLATDDVTQELKDLKTVKTLADEYTDALVYLVETTRTCSDAIRIPKIVNALTEMRTTCYFFIKEGCSIKENFPEIQMSELFKEMTIFCPKEKKNHIKNDLF